MAVAVLPRQIKNPANCHVYSTLPKKSASTFKARVKNIILYLLIDFPVDMRSNFVYRCQSTYIITLGEYTITRERLGHLRKF